MYTIYSSELIQSIVNGSIYIIDKSNWKNWRNTYIPCNFHFNRWSVTPLVENLNVGLKRSYRFLSKAKITNEILIVRRLTYCLCTNTQICTRFSKQLQSICCIFVNTYSGVFSPTVLDLFVFTQGPMSTHRKLKTVGRPKWTDRIIYRPRKSHFQNMFEILLKTSELLFIYNDLYFPPHENVPGMCWRSLIYSSVNCTMFWYFSLGIGN